MTFLQTELLSEQESISFCRACRNADGFESAELMQNRFLDGVTKELGRMGASPNLGYSKGRRDITISCSKGRSKGRLWGGL